jgi:hypothetical protein
LEIEVPEYAPEEGVRLKWDRDFTIDVRVMGNEVVVRANRDGLVSLARHLLHLSQDTVPIGTHFHLDPDNSLEDTSCSLIVERSFD